MHSVKGISETIIGSLNQILDITQDMCTHCGECCKSELFFLSDVEAPIIAQHLLKKGGIQLVKDHIRENPTVFNRFGRYIFHFTDLCPFHLDKRCILYSDRPMVCRLFPLVFLGFFDSMNMELRDAVFAIDRGQGNYACESIIVHVEDILKEVVLNQPSHSIRTLRKMLASSLLDKRGLAYCFGQPRQRGKHFVNANGIDLRSWILTEAHLYMKFAEVFGFLPSDWVANSKLLSDEAVNKLASDRAAMKASTKTSRRLRYLNEHNPQIWSWFNDSRDDQ